MSVVPFSRVRLLNHVLMVLTLASLSAPHRGIGAFFLSPTGLSVAALMLFVTGASLEEAGSLLKIRAGALLRLLATVVLGAATAWACATESPSLGGLSAEVLACAGLLVALCFAPREAWTLRDVRHAQRQRLLSVLPDGIDLSIGEARVMIPAGAITSVALVQSEQGRGAQLRLEPSAVGQDVLPLLSERADGDELVLVLTEHQSALDAEVLVRKLRALSNKSPSGYR